MLSFLALLYGLLGIVCVLLGDNFTGLFWIAISIAALIGAEIVSAIRGIFK